MPSFVSVSPDDLTPLRSVRAKAFRLCGGMASGGAATPAADVIHSCSKPTGRRVAELRHQGGFSVPEFAGLLRVSASTVYRWEAARGPLALRAGQEDALQVLYRAIEKRQT